VSVLKSAAMAALFGMTAAVSSANAVPVMNENASVSRNTTIFPDHADPNVFYIAPNVISLCIDGDKVPRFSYQDLEVRFGTQGIVQMTLCAQYNELDLAAAETALIAKSAAAKLPAPRFVALPFVSSAVVFDPVLKPFIVKEYCSHTAGMVGDEESCSFRLNSQGRRVFLRQVHDRLSMTMQYEYQVAGFLRKPDGSYAPENTIYGIAVRFGGEDLKNHPELFSDANGRTLKAR